MKELFEQIEALVPTLGDWCSIPKATAMAAAVIALRPAITVEIGVFSGASFLPMALAHKYIDHGVAYAIDPWNKQDSVEGMDKANADWWSSVDHDKVYEDFLKKLSELGLENYAYVYRSKSDEVKPPLFIQNLNIDGNHGEQAIRDVARYASNVVIGGLCWMDDLQWVGGATATAADNLKAMGFVKLYDQDTGALFQRVSK